MGPKEIGREGVGWIHMAQHRDQWWALVNTVMNPRDNPCGVSPPVEGEWPVAVRPHISLKRRPHFKTRKSFGKNKNMVMVPDGTRNQD
jgi:hypothetical protein